MTSEIMTDIALIGMMGSGKTTVGRELAKLTRKRFIDTDAVFTEKYGNISDFFLAHGEKEFRLIEKKITLDSVSKRGCVISLGGGVILNSELMTEVKSECIVVLLDCSVEEIVLRLINDRTRPLIRTSEDIRRIYNERRSLYLNYADFTIDNTAMSASESAEEILRMLGTDLNLDK